MKTWEKIQKLDLEYVEARKRLVLGQIDSVIVTQVHLPQSPIETAKPTPAEKKLTEKG
jgi:hypothetical protein